MWFDLFVNLVMAGMAIGFIAISNSDGPFSVKRWSPAEEAATWILGISEGVVLWSYLLIGGFNDKRCCQYSNDIAVTKYSQANCCLTYFRVPIVVVVGFLTYSAEYLPFKVYRWVFVAAWILWSVQSLIFFVRMIFLLAFIFLLYFYSVFHFIFTRLVCLTACLLTCCFLLPVAENGEREDLCGFIQRVCDGPFRNCIENTILSRFCCDIGYHLYGYQFISRRPRRRKHTREGDGSKGDEERKGKDQLKQRKLPRVNSAKVVPYEADRFDDGARNEREERKINYAASIHDAYDWGEERDPCLITCHVCQKQGCLGDSCFHSFFSCCVHYGVCCGCNPCLRYHHPDYNLHPIDRRLALARTFTCDQFLCCGNCLCCLSPPQDKQYYWPCYIGGGNIVTQSRCCQTVFYYKVRESVRHRYRKLDMLILFEEMPGWETDIETKRKGNEERRVRRRSGLVTAKEREVYSQSRVSIDDENKPEVVGSLAWRESKRREQCRAKAMAYTFTLDDVWTQRMNEAFVLMSDDDNDDYGCIEDSGVEENHVKGRHFGPEQKDHDRIGGADNTSRFEELECGVINVPSKEQVSGLQRTQGSGINSRTSYGPPHTYANGFIPPGAPSQQPSFGLVVSLNQHTSSPLSSLGERTMLFDPYGIQGISQNQHDIQASSVPLDIVAPSGAFGAYFHPSPS